RGRRGNTRRLLPGVRARRGTGSTLAFRAPKTRDRREARAVARHAGARLDREKDAPGQRARVNGHRAGAPRVDGATGAVGIGGGSSGRDTTIEARGTTGAGCNPAASR